MENSKFHSKHIVIIANQMKLQNNGILFKITYGMFSHIVFYILLEDRDYVAVKFLKQVLIVSMKN